MFSYIVGMFWKRCKLEGTCTIFYIRAQLAEFDYLEICQDPRSEQVFPEYVYASLGCSFRNIHKEIADSDESCGRYSF